MDGRASLAGYSASLLTEKDLRLVPGQCFDDGVNVGSREHRRSSGVMVPTDGWNRASGTGRRLDGRLPGFGRNTEESLVWYVSMGCGLQSRRHTLLLWRRSCITGPCFGSRLFNVPVPVPVLCQWWFVTARLRRHRVYGSG